MVKMQEQPGANSSSFDFFLYFGGFALKHRREINIIQRKTIFNDEIEKDSPQQDHQVDQLTYYTHKLDTKQENEPFFTP